MAVTAQRYGTISCQDGVLKAVKVGDIPINWDNGVYNPLMFSVYAGVQCDPGETISISILINGVTFGGATETGLYAQAYSGIFASTNGKNFTRSGGAPNSCILTKGLTESSGFTILISVAPGNPTKTVDITINYNDDDSQAIIDAAPGPGPDADPTDPDAQLQANADNPAEDDIKLTWTDNASNEDGYKVERRKDGGLWVTIGGVAASVGEYTDSYQGLTNGNYDYRITGFNDTGFTNPITTPVVPHVGGGGGGGGGNTTIWVGGDPVAPQLSYPIWFTGEPSGIYTLEKDKDIDTLYDRSGASTTVDVQIPDPFFKSGYLGG